MAPIAIHTNPKDSLNAEAESFKPVGNKQVDPYHSATSATAIAAESAYAAHNYHPLPVVFSRAQGVDVWDPEGTFRRSAAWPK
jgi:ornithine--oxo-acid transaminase